MPTCLFFAWVFQRFSTLSYIGHLILEFPRCEMFPPRMERSECFKCHQYHLRLFENEQKERMLNFLRLCTCLLEDVQNDIARSSKMTLAWISTPCGSELRKLHCFVPAPLRFETKFVEDWGAGDAFMGGFVEAIWQRLHVLSLADWQTLQSRTAGVRLFSRKVFATWSN